VDCSRVFPWLRPDYSDFHATGVRPPSSYSVPLVPREDRFGWEEKLPGASGDPSDWKVTSMANSGRGEAGFPNWLAPVSILPHFGSHDDADCSAEQASVAR
jgi:hypothetical protein